MTGQDEQSIRKMLVTMTEQLNLEHLRKITVVCVTDPDRLMRENVTLLGRCEGDDGAEEGRHSQITSSQADLGT